MAFLPRGKEKVTFPSQTASMQDSSSDFVTETLVDQIAQAVREKLLSQGVPLQRSDKPSSSQEEWKEMIHHGADRISHSGESPFQPHVLQGDASLSNKIDHTLLKPDSTPEEIKRICQEARKYHFATVCVNSNYVGIAAEYLKGSSTKAIAVVGFPLGAASTASKAFETREAIKVGAQEIDMVVNIGALKARDLKFVFEDIKQVVDAAHPYPVKVILETSSLTQDEKIITCALSKAAGAAFVKTSTGFGGGGATAEDVQLMRNIVGPEMGVKASGGIRTYEDASKMIEAGASRIGASASIEIVTKKSSATSNKDEKKKKYKTSLY